MEIKTDSAGQKYVETKFNDNSIRITQASALWANEKCVRIQMRSVEGKLYQGPDVPYSKIGDVVSGVIALLVEN